MLCYCKKCGRIIIQRKGDDMSCDYCHNVVFPVPDEFLGGKSKLFIKADLKEQFFNEYIISSSEFNQYLYDHRDTDLFNQRMREKELLEHGMAVLEGKNKKVTCPYCSSTRCSRISILGRMVSFEFWGLASNKLGKQWHCDDCGSNF